MSRSVVIGLLLAAIVALALRCPALKQRPMHNDEAVNAIKFRSLWDNGIYRFDPTEHHGPTLHYLTLVWGKLNGVKLFRDFDESLLRGLTVAAGVGLIFALLLVADGLGRNATVCSALLIAISPAMVFYSRYYIHEMLLVLFTFLALGAAWRYYQSRKLVWAVLAGVAVGLMQTTKETFVLALAAAAIALALNKLWESQSAEAPAHLNYRHIAGAIIAWLAVAVVLFSSLFSNVSGLVDAVRTYSTWLERAGGHSPHVHPWYFYFERLLFFHAKGGPLWSEGLIFVLALIGFITALTGRVAAESHKGFLKFLAFYTVTLTAIYTVIPYKTPWCLLGFWHGAILLAGVGTVALWVWTRRAWVRAVVAILLLSGSAQLAFQAREASVAFAADQRNPYVYAQTSLNLLELVNRVDAIARIHPQGRRMTIKVMSPRDDYWPLPWYFRAFDRTGWWAEVPNDPLAPVMIVSTKYLATFDERTSHVRVGIFELRTDAFLALYVEKNLWESYLNSPHQSSDAD